MKVTITHSTTTQGLMRKTTYFNVAVAVQFSTEERGVIERYDLGVLEVLERQPPATARGGADSERGLYNLTVAGLLRGENTYLCATPLEAKSYDSELRDALPKLKAYLDANAMPRTGSDTFEL